MSDRATPNCARRRSAPPTPAEVRVRALFGAISRGTERLVVRRPCAAERISSACARRFMGGAFPFPVKYGYATVGRVEEGPPRCAVAMCSRSIRIRTVFIVPADLAQIVPDGVPPARAVLAANMETALNALWDGAPGPADRIAVVGGGVVGTAGGAAVRPDAGCGGDGGRHRPGRARSSHARSASRFAHAGRSAGATATSSFTPAARRPDCDRAAARRRGGHRR